jgi:diadenylate cyclase
MLQLTVLDIIDIFLVAIILFQLYKLIRGTAAFSIFIGIFFVYLFWLVVKALNMELIGSILGQVIGVGVIALIIVFQQEIRRFLLVMGNRYMNKNRFSFTAFFPEGGEEVLAGQPEAEEVVRVVSVMAENKTGALMVIARRSSLDLYAESGERIGGRISAALIETIFFKNSPLHDGAILIQSGVILAARCPLPVTDKPNMPSRFGMRHRAAIGITEHTDAYVIVVSEETGRISVVDAGEIREDINVNELRLILQKERV